VNKPMMKCGHAANAVNSRNEPVCVICYGIVPGADQVDDAPPDLTGRMARCAYCRHEQPSSTDLPFFEYGHFERGQRLYDHDEYYCGCRGWD
jgi:hypothetical protein